MLGDQALDKICNIEEVKTVLDVGSGYCNHSNKLADCGKDVTAIDLYDRPAKLDGRVSFVKGLFEHTGYLGKFDCVWCSHVLEHVLNTQSFLEKLIDHVKDDGYLAITVPPLKDDIVGGHVSLFNAGIILYRLILAGLDVKEAKVKKYGYNISIIVKKKRITDDIYSKLVFDRGDIETLSPYFPEGYNFHGFDGNIEELNWD